MVKNNYSKAYTYTVIVNIRFANGIKEKLCRYTCDINLNPLIDKDGTPTVEFANWIIENHPEFKVSDVLDKDSRIYFEFVDSPPDINI